MAPLKNLPLYIWTRACDLRVGQVCRHKAPGCRKSSDWTVSKVTAEGEATISRGGRSWTLSRNVLVLLPVAERFGASLKGGAA